MILYVNMINIIVVFPYSIYSGVVAAMTDLKETVYFQDEF